MGIMLVSFQENVNGKLYLCNFVLLLQALSLVPCRFLYESARTKDLQPCADYIVRDVPSACCCATQGFRGAGHL